MATTTGKLLTQEERKLCEKIAELNIMLVSQRAKALLLLNDGHTQIKSAELSSLTIGQLRYLLVLFKQKRTNLFPEHILPEPDDKEQEEPETPLPEPLPEPEPEPEPEVADSKKKKKGKKKKGKKSKGKKSAAKKDKKTKKDKKNKAEKKKVKKKKKNK